MFRSDNKYAEPVLGPIPDPVKSGSGFKVTQKQVFVGKYGSKSELPMHIDVQNLEKVYPAQKGLYAASFQVEKGESVAIVGHNGAGKSTLLKMLAGWIVPDSGTARIDGFVLQKRTALVRKIGFVPEKPNLFDFFSVEYNLKLFARLFQVSFERVEQTLQEFDLLSYRRNKIEVLSKGLVQRVSIGRSLLADPPILILDEPTSGLDFEMTRHIYNLLGKIHASGKTVLFTSHRPEEIRTLATRIITIHHGHLVFDGAPADYFQSNIHEKLYA